MSVHFPKLTIKGGPHGKNVVVELDGKPIERSPHIEFTTDVNDVIRAKIFQFVEVDIDVEAEVASGQIWLKVRVPEVLGMLEDGLREIRLKTLITVSGPDLASALRAAADKADGLVS